MMLNYRGRYAAFKISSISHCPKTMKNSCIRTLLVDSFRQFDQNQSVGNCVSLFEVHITLGFKSEVSTLFFRKTNITSLKKNRNEEK
jgi:hypothetical protein